MSKEVYIKFFLIGINVLLFGGAFFWLIIGVLNYFHLEEHASDWVQAVGSLLALVVAIGVSWNEQRSSREERVKERQESRDELANENKRVAQAYIAHVANVAVSAKFISESAHKSLKKDPTKLGAAGILYSFLDVKDLLQKIDAINIHDLAVADAISRIRMNFLMALGEVKRFDSEVGTLAQTEIDSIINNMGRASKYIADELGRIEKRLPDHGIASVDLE